ncbi:hypothetical protein JOD43_000417 [Pullulanibacillus pueri]|uniref:Uncharacterized protein n=1 Tax=Pullulanibacillus pueri TaxID=1437324 RepID=A0A8J2ZTT2_9BACL|nr:hypothetical protein [Pullulanibacillus pueri]GGH75979.1 hypothetical protein GCM10007096_05750 [Pullulanibacillus pueri]
MIAGIKFSGDFLFKQYDFSINLIIYAARVEQVERRFLFFTCSLRKEDELVGISRHKKKV